MLTDLIQPPRGLKSDLVTPSDVGGYPAWRSLLLDQHLKPVWDSYAICAHKEITQRHRAAALRPQVQARTVLGRLSALWVLTGHLGTRQVQLLYAPTQHRPQPRAGCQTHQTTLTAQDTIEIDGVRLTSPTRTAVDIAIHVERREALLGLRALAEHRLVRIEQVLERLTQIPGRSRRTESVDLVQWALSPTTRSSYSPSNQ